MQKNIIKIYALSICFVTTVIMIISLFIILSSTLEMFMPEYVKYSDLSKYNSNDEFKFSYSHRDKLKNKSNQEIEQMRIQERAYELNKIKSQGLERLIGAILWLCVSVPFFLIHWRINAKF
jgi:hypothetical protein